MGNGIPARIRVIDSHTGGEPTRVVIEGLPDLGSGPLAERCARFARDFDAYRSAVVNEPRGSDIVVGALLCEPFHPECDAGVIFFNNVGTLPMCGHGTIGLLATLAHLGRIHTSSVTLDTPAGVVKAALDAQGKVTVKNVRSYRFQKDAAVDVPGLGRVTGDVAWGGNWFFLVNDHKETLEVRNAERLTDAAWRIRKALTAAGITGAGGAEIDHVELFGPPADPANHSRNFVLCPGKAYDRSPCGTGTSAKLACLFADGKLAAGQIWRQESILGSVFEGYVEAEDPGAQEPGVLPVIRGSAFITGESTLLFHPNDPFRCGIRP